MHTVRLGALVVVVGACMGACAGPAEESRHAASVESRGARELVAAGATLLDVRTAEEFAAGHVEGALNIPVDEVATRTAEIPRDRPVVVYCRSGRRSERAAATLVEQGYEAYDLGPMSAW